MEQSSLDEIDRRILYHLQQDARRAITDVADDVGVSDDTVRNRIQRPEGEGVIDGYPVDVSSDDADVQHYYVFVRTAHVGEREALAREAGRLPGIVEVRTLMTGTRNVHLTAVGPEKDDITRLAQSIDELGLTIERGNFIRSYSGYPFDGSPRTGDRSERRTFTFFRSKSGDRFMIG